MPGLLRGSTAATRHVRVLVSITTLRMTCQWLMPPPPLLLRIIIIAVMPPATFSGPPPMCLSAAQLVRLTWRWVVTALAIAFRIPCAPHPAPAAVMLLGVAMRQPFVAG